MEANTSVPQDMQNGINYLQIALRMDMNPIVNIKFALCRNKKICFVFKFQ